MSDGRLRFGIIGCGGIAQSRHMPSLSRLPEVELAAFFDPTPARAEAARKSYGVRDAGVYADYKALLQDSSIDVVHVCTTNASHAEIAIAALEAGKHVLCEKPMATTPEDARRMVETARRTGRKLTVGYNNRFRPDSQLLYQICRQGDLGHIYYAKALALRRRGVPSWGAFLDREKQGGGPLVDVGSHALDLTLWLMDNWRPRLVLGSTYAHLGKRAGSANDWAPWDPEKFTVEDSAFGFVIMENGATVVVESSWALNVVDEGEGRALLCGTEAGADMVDDGVRLNGDEFGQRYVKHLDVARDFTSQPPYGHELQCRLWVDAILRDEEPLVRPEEALVVTEILDAIYRSASSGEAIHL